MKGTSITRLTLMAGVCSLGSATAVEIAWAQDQPGQTVPAPGGATTVRERTIVGTIASIDKVTRTVTVTDSRGVQAAVYVPPDSSLFDKLRVGDEVNVSYTESLAIGMGPPGQKTSVEKSTDTSQSPLAPGQPGTATTRVVATVQVTAVDTATSQVTFKGPDGNTKTVTVADPSLQEKMKALKPGDTIQLVYTRSVAGSITPASKK